MSAVAFLGCSDGDFMSPNRENTYRGFFVQARLSVDNTSRRGQFGVVDPEGRLSQCIITTVSGIL